MHYRTIIASDIHVPSPDNKGKEFLQRLKNQTCEQLILNGDIIDGWHIKLFGGRKRRHANRLKDIIEIAQGQWVKIKYIIGNHDIALDRTAPRLEKEVDILPDMIYTTGKKKYYICHGHQFDKLEGRFTRRSKMTFFGGTFLYRCNRVYNEIRKKFGLRSQSLVAPIKRWVKTLMVGWAPLFRKKLIKTCKAQRTQGIICGHLHKTENKYIGRYHYLNSWDRIYSCTVLVENENGKREIINNRS